MYHYSTPPGWTTCDYTTSPPTSPHYAYYASQFASPYASPRGSAKRHTRKASYSATTTTSKEHPGAWNPVYGHGFYDAMPEYGSPRKHDHVSAFSGRRPSEPSPQPQPPRHHNQRRYTMAGSQPWGDGNDLDDDDQPYSPCGRSAGAAPPPTTPRQDDRRFASTSQRKAKPPTDQYFYYTQVPSYDDASTTADAAKRSRARRQSTSTRTPSKPKPMSPSTPPPRKATEEDALRVGIPPGYSIKNWDPTEAPIILLGSVFDANSLGKWIYDWTVFHHGASTPMADVAGDLWLLLIKLAGKVKRADDCLPRIQRSEAQETVVDFLESGERLWGRVKKLLKACESFMWKAAKRESGGKGGVSMGRNAGCEFVESIFGRDRELENTEKLMNSIRLWNMRFDANCEEILRRPSA